MGTLAVHPDCGKIVQYNGDGAEIAPAAPRDDRYFKMDSDPFMPKTLLEELHEELTVNSVMNEAYQRERSRLERKAVAAAKRAKVKANRERAERRRARPLKAALVRIGVVAIRIEGTRYPENEDLFDAWYERTTGRELDVFRDGVLNREVEEIWNGNRGGDTERNVELFGKRISITVRCFTEAGYFMLRGKNVKERAERLMRLDGCDLGDNKL